MRAVLAAGLCALLCGSAIAANLPDPSHVTFQLPKDIKWTPNQPGADQAVLFGDPKKPGLYGLLIKWHAGHFSHPHFHNTDRFAYVISGTWWISSSDTYDPGKTYPLPAGSTATDLANTVHWDGAKDGDAVIELVGMGPVTTTEATATAAKPK